MKLKSIEDRLNYFIECHDKSDTTVPTLVSGIKQKLSVLETRVNENVECINSYCLLSPSLPAPSHTPKHSVPLLEDSDPNHHHLWLTMGTTIAQIWICFPLPPPPITGNGTPLHVVLL